MKSQSKITSSNNTSMYMKKVMLGDCFFQRRRTAFSIEGPHIRLVRPFIFDLIAGVVYLKGRNAAVGKEQWRNEKLSVN